jgi:hypothetical protein
MSTEGVQGPKSVADVSALVEAMVKKANEFKGAG